MEKPNESIPKSLFFWLWAGIFLFCYCRLISRTTEEKKSILFHALEKRCSERNGYSIFTDKLKLKQLTLFFFLSLVCSFLLYWMRHIKQMCWMLFICVWVCLRAQHWIHGVVYLSKLMEKSLNSCGPQTLQWQRQVIKNCMAKALSWLVLMIVNALDSFEFDIWQYRKWRKRKKNRQFFLSQLLWLV